MDGLTRRQLQCLRGKWDRKMDKEIAHELGISQRAVESHLRGAREKLDAASTRAAVLIAARAQGWEGSVEPNGGSADLPAACDFEAFPIPDEAGRSSSAGTVRDSWSRPGIQYATDDPAARWPLPTREGQRNDLNTTQRLIWPFAIAVLAMAVLFLGFGVLNGAGRFVGVLVGGVS